jgi:hypothetical protein
VFVTHVSGKVENMDGTPVKGGVYSICGSVCLNLNLTSAGTFVFAQERCFSKEGLLTRPFFIYHGTGEQLEVFFDFVDPEATVVDNAVLPTLFTMPLASMSSITFNASGQNVLSDGTGFELTFNGPDTDFPLDLTKTGVKAVAPEHRPPLPGMESVEGLWATYPADVIFKKPAVLKLPNTAGLAPGTMVEIVEIGITVTTTPYPGSMEKVDDGKVSDDGTSIVSVNGVNSLGWFGYRTVPLDTTRNAITGRELASLRYPPIRLILP